MAVLFSHGSALAILRAVPPQCRTLKQVKQPLNMAELSTRASDLSAVDLDPYGIAEAHVLVAKGASRSAAKGVILHSCSLAVVPAGLIWQLAEGVYVCGPELTHIQMSTQLSLLGATVLGYELCGSYSQFARMISGFYDRKPLTSKARIAEAITQLPRTAGVNKARAALEHVCDASHSPMETVVSAMLYLPAQFGGYGLKMPSLNHRVKLDKAASTRLGQKTCAIDAAWPEQLVGLEYDSAAYHPDPEKDRRRREALSRMGWTIFTLAPNDVRDVDSLSKMADLFIDKIPHETANAVASKTQQAELLKRLFTLTRYGLGMRSLLFAEPDKTRTVQVHL